MARTLSSSDRIFVGLFIQPFVAGVLAFIAFPLLLLDRHGRTLAGGYPVDVTDSARSVAVGVGIVAGLVTLIGVLPTAVWLMKRRYLTLQVTLVFGLAFGNLPYTLGVVAAGTYGGEAFLRGVALSSFLGLTGAALFWFIALWPEKSRLNRGVSGRQDG